MRSIIFLLIIISGGALFFEVSRPIEVKSVTYTLEGARLTLARRSLLNLAGRFEWKEVEFTETIYLKNQSSERQELVDFIRSKPLLCGPRPCVLVNPVADELREVTRKLYEAHQSSSAASDALRTAEVKFAKTQEAFERDECTSHLSVQAPVRHPMACDPGSERTTSEGLCLVATLGPDACAKYAGDEVFSKIAASEACSTAAAALLNESRTGSEREADAMFGLMSHASGAVLKSAKEGNIFAWLLTPYAAAVKLVELQRKIDGFNGCVPKAIQKCSNSYQSWRASLAAFEEEFGPKIASCGELNAKLSILKSEVSNGIKYKAELDVAIAEYEKSTKEIRSKEVNVEF